MMAIAEEEIKKRLEEIRKLPPKDRLGALAKFQEEVRKAKEESRKKQEEEEEKVKKETETILKTSIDEIAYEEEEEEKLKEDEEKKKKEKLEDIAEKARTPKKEERRPDTAYQSNFSREAYVSSLSKLPVENLYDSLKEVQQAQLIRGYLNHQELNKVHNIGEAIYQKQKSEYKGTKESRMIISRTTELIEEMTNLLKKEHR